MNRKTRIVYLLPLQLNILRSQLNGIINQSDTEIGLCFNIDFYAEIEFYGQFGPPWRTENPLPVRHIFTGVDITEEDVATAKKSLYGSIEL